MALEDIEIIQALTKDVRQFVLTKVNDQAIQEKLLENLDYDILSGNIVTLQRISTILEIFDYFQLSQQNIEEFFKGGHFVVQDGGGLYHSLMKHGYERISTHYSYEEKIGSDIGIEAGQTIAHILIGRTASHSWFQIENTPMPAISDIFNDYNEFSNFIGHSKDALVYLSSLKSLNVGQYGYSSFTEKNPISLDFKTDSQDCEYQTFDNLFESEFCMSYM